MKRPETKCVLIVMAMFTFAVAYASYCSTSCALEDLAEAARHSGSHHSSGRSQGSHNDGSGDPGCAAADHLGACIPAAVGIAQVEFSKVDRVTATLPGMRPLATSSSMVSSFWLSGLAPPPKQKSPLYQQISVLRV
jgi:hypothetical protein